MERWGVFSVIDHKDDLRLATELLLYDKIAVPTPIDRDGADWHRWEGKGWEPDKLMRIVERLKPPGLVIETEWDLDRQKNWRKCFDEAKADIDKVSTEIQSDLDMRVADVKRAMAGGSKEDRDKAVQSAAWWATRDEIIRHLKGLVGIHYGPVEFYAAYQSKADFDLLHPAEDSIKQGVEQVNFLIQHRLAVPDEAPEILLDRVINLATKPAYKDRRRVFYDWQISLLQRRHKPEQILRELNQLVRDFNAQVDANDQKCREETVITVLQVSGAALSAWLSVDPNALSAITHVPDAGRYAAVAGGLNTAGIAVWRKLRSRKQVDDPHRIAAPGAMFHQTEADTGFEFRTHRDDNAMRPQKF